MPSGLLPQGQNEDEAAHMALNVSYAQGVDIVHGFDMHKKECFASMSCSCKVNYILSQTLHCDRWLHSLLNEQAMLFEAASLSTFQCDWQT